jgi:SAM-dependent methyltransferase
MELPNRFTLADVARKGRNTVRNVYHALYRRVRRPLSGEYNPYNYTLPDRYPWLFSFAATQIGPRQNLRILSFGCSRGDEVFSLRKYFPTAAIKGIDINPRNIAHGQARLRADEATGIEFATAATTQGESTGSYDAIFCLAVLCNGELTMSGAERCDPLLRFERFDWLVGDFARCLKPRGLLVLHTTSFRFCDTAVAPDFDVVLEAEPAQLSPGGQFDRNNRFMSGMRYRSVAFQKR